ncbi:MAG: hypothetical protein ACXWM7_06810 [Parachlamydiaceae bacterium]
MNNLPNILPPFESSYSELNSSFQVAFQQDIETSDPHSIDLILFNCGQVKNGADLEKIEPFLI